MSIEVGSILEGKVTGITNFGAFVELADGQTGLVHISEVADEYVHDINDHLKENDIVKVRVINLDRGRIGLSIRQVASPDSERPGGGGRRGASPRGRRPGGRPSLDFEERLRQFIKDSEQRQQELRRSQAAKRGGRGAKRDG